MARQHAERIMAVEAFAGDGRAREKIMTKGKRVEENGLNR
jgi:hypothetical protein